MLIPQVGRCCVQARWVPAAPVTGVTVLANGHEQHRAPVRFCASTRLPVQMQSRTDGVPGTPLRSPQHRPTRGRKAEKANACSTLSVTQSPQRDRAPGPHSGPSLLLSPSAPKETTCFPIPISGPASGGTKPPRGDRRRTEDTRPEWSRGAMSPHVPHLSGFPWRSRLPSPAMQVVGLHCHCCAFTPVLDPPTYS